MPDSEWLTEEERLEIRTAIANGYYDHTAENKVSAAVESIVARHRAAVLAEVAAALHAEIDHAGVNGHILDKDCQGVGPGEKVDALRASVILAVLGRFDRATTTEGTQS